MTELNSGIILQRIMEISASRPYEGEYHDHGAAGISIEVGHRIKILSMSKLIKQNIENIQTALH